ncbi:MAG: phosphatase PAP2 family protein [Betaproteobacteria bacterium]|nr:phosphatase PAP2 family protein [Betaproteobacteria bacterium]
MNFDTARTGWTLLASITLVGCASIPPPPPTELPEVRRGYVAGYLQPDQLPDGLALLPPPPAAGSAALAADEEAYRATRALRDTPRWGQATADAVLEFPKAAGHFSCALDMPISAQSTPHLNMLLRRVRMDASRALDLAKSHYKRKRPYAVTGEASCTPKEEAKMKPDSYPSGHASIGWAWALTLAELSPERANAIFARGLSFGQSRVVCGVHWKSDVDTGRVIGAATVSRLHADPVYTAQMVLARSEIEAARAADLKSPRDCAAEARALAIGK